MLKIFSVKNCIVWIKLLSKMNANHLYPCTFQDLRYYCLEKRKLEVKAFENVKNQIGFCGIWCGSCGAGNGAIQELAKRFEEIVKNYELEKWVPKEFDFKEFMKGLACTQSTPLCIGCQKGGGPPTCKVRICALGKGILDCSQCDQLIECKNFEQLEKSHLKIKQDLMEIKKRSRPALIEKWMGELKSRWPHCILFCASTEK
jgi:hypothetical protein